MAVMPREKWTDERLDDLNGRVDAGFAQVDKDIRELRSEIRGMNRTLFAGFFAVFAAIVGTNVFF